MKNITLNLEENETDLDLACDLNDTGVDSSTGNILYFYHPVYGRGGMDAKLPLKCLQLPENYEVQVEIKAGAGDYAPYFADKPVIEALKFLGLWGGTITIKPKIKN